LIVVILVFPVKPNGQENIRVGSCLCMCSQKEQAYIKFKVEKRVNFID